MTRRRPQVVVFDVIETLASLAAVADVLEQVGLGRGLLERWFGRLLRDGFALTTAGSYVGFADVAASALRAECRGSVSEDQVRQVLGGFAELVPHPDAAPAVRAAIDAGLRVFTLTNGAAATTRAFLHRAGLDQHVEQVLSIDEVQAWKPAPAAYRLAIDRAGVPAGAIALVAVHSWDIHGAHAAGMTTGWCPRLEAVPTPVFAPADVRAANLADVVRGLADLPACTTRSGHATDNYQVNGRATPPAGRDGAAPRRA